MRRRTLLVCVSVVASLAGEPSALQRTADPPSIQLRVGFARAGGYGVETIPLEAYVARVLAGEAARDSRPAALEALAITIRTYALGNRDRHRADGFDVCDETHCQVVRTATPGTTSAAQATAGQVLMRNASIASVFYSASCGGRTEVPSNVWPGADDPPHLPSAHDEACEGAPQWQADLSEADLLRAFRAAGFRGNRIRSLRVAERNASDRVARVRVDGLTPADVSGQDLRVVVGRTLGWQHIKSAAFEVGRRGSTYRFVGHGYGHGVGLCVIGSTNLAADGTNATAILAKYFPGTVIAPAGPRFAPGGPAIGPDLPAVPRTPPPAVLLSLPDDDEGERASIVRLAANARDELSKSLGVPPPPTVTLRFHPTTDDYERATGRPWFTSGAWADGELHLLPLAILRERGVLDRTVRHELVHAMTDEVLGGRPAWVKEGAAIFFAGEQPVPGEPARAATPEARGPCPKDDELLYPASVGALTTAYARARSCFARQIEGGRSWREVR